MFPSKPPFQAKSGGGGNRTRVGFTQRPPSQAKSYVYFIQSGDDGPIKIGVAGNPLKRLAGLQVANPVPLHLLGACEDTDGVLEGQLHDRLCKHRLTGEWFTPAPQVRETVARHARPYPPPASPKQLEMLIPSTRTPEEQAEIDAIVIAQWGSLERFEEVAARMRKLTYFPESPKW